MRSFCKKQSSFINRATRRWAGLGLLLLTLLACASAATAQSLPAGMAAWFKADGISGLSSGDAVASWPDASGGGAAAQGDTSWQPHWVTNAVNGKPVVRFNGHSYLDAAYAPEGQLTLFAVMAFANFDQEMVPLGSALVTNQDGGLCFGAWSSSGPHNGLLFQTGVGGSWVSGSNHFTVTTLQSGFHLYEFRIDASSTSIWVDGQRLLNDTAFGAIHRGNALRLGALPYQGVWDPLSGDMAEVIAYGRALSETDRKTVEQYLGDKYGLGIASSPDVTATAGDGQVSLSWTAPSGATGYHVKRATASGGPYTTVASPTGTSYTDTGLTNGTTYYYVVTAVTGGVEGPPSDEVYATPTGVVGTGTGLAGQYFADQTLGTAVLSRTDGTIDFDWGAGAPDPALPVDHFSVRWQGQVQPQYTQTYTFFATADDGIRLRVNGQLLIDRWTDGGGTATGTIALTAGQKYDITMEYYENGGGASAHLEWACPGLPRQVVPQALLYLLPPGEVTGLSAAPDNGQVHLSWAPADRAGGYTVKRATTSGGPYTAVGTSGTTSYTDAGVTNGTAYFYEVSAVSGGLEGPASDEAMAAPLAPASADTASPVYGYDGDGLRAWKAAGSATTGARTYFLYDGDTPVAEMDAQGNVTATNTFGPTGLISRHATTGGSTFYAFDPQGSAAARLDSTGTVLAYYTLDAFGSRVGTDSSDDPYSGFGGQWGYYADAETGLELLTHRYYDVATGRFVTRDPISYNGGVNLYAYTANNPINESDPSGLQTPKSALPRFYKAPGGPYRPGIPDHPAGVDIVDTVSDANNFAVLHPLNPIALKNWLYNQVKTGGPWDFKQWGMHYFPKKPGGWGTYQYDDFGNFNYGVVCASLGIPEGLAIGRADQAHNKTWHGHHNPNDHGDDWIRAGYKYWSNNQYYIMSEGWRRQGGQINGMPIKLW